MPTRDELTLDMLGGRLGNPNAQGPYNFLRTIGEYVAPQLTDYFTRPEEPYSKRLESFGGTIGPGGQLIPPTSGKIPSVVDPRLQGAQQEAFDLASNLVPAKLGLSVAAAPLMGVAKRAAAAARIPGAMKTGISSVNLRQLPLDEALGIARSERHIIPKEGGGMVGAPSWVQNAEDLTKMRADFDAQVEAGMAGAPWYKHAQSGIKEMAGPDPAKQHLLAQEKALFSPQSTPDVNLGYTLAAHNAYEAGQPLDIARTGAQARMYREARTAGTDMAEGAKTGVYAKHLDPTLENPTTGTNDIWHARSFGYVDAEGKPWNSALTAQQHSFMDAETMLAVDRANARKLGGRDNWTAGEIQAAPWVARKTEGLMEQFGWPREKAAAEAIKTYNSFFDKYTAYGTHEATPGIGTRHLPDVPGSSFEERAAFSAPRNWQDQQGRDVIYDALGMYQRPTVPATGVYQSAAGPLETNPANVARPMVGITGPTGDRSIDPASRAMMTGAEGLRAYSDVQNMGAFSMPIHGQKAGVSGSVELPSRAPLSLAQINELQKTGGEIGLPNVIDYGKSSVLTSFGDQPTVRELGKGIKTRGEELARIASGREIGPMQLPDRVKLDTGMVNYEPQFARQEGTGAATHLLMRTLKSKEAPAMFAKLDRDPAIRAKILERMNLDAELAARTGQPVREDVQRAREIIAKDGLTGLLRALRSGVALPAAAIVPLAAALRDQSQGE